MCAATGLRGRHPLKVFYLFSGYLWNLCWMWRRYVLFGRRIWVLELASSSWPLHDYLDREGSWRPFSSIQSLGNYLLSRVTHGEQSPSSPGIYGGQLPCRVIINCMQWGPRRRCLRSAWDCRGLWAYRMWREWLIEGDTWISAAVIGVHLQLGWQERALEGTAFARAWKSLG